MVSLKSFCLLYHVQDFFTNNFEVNHSCKWEVYLHLFIFINFNNNFRAAIFAGDVVPSSRRSKVWGTTFKGKTEVAEGFQDHYDLHKFLYHFLGTLNSVYSCERPSGPCLVQLWIEWSRFEPGPGHCFVFRGKTLYPCSPSLHPGV